MPIGVKTKVAIGELGMLGGVGVAMFTVPESTPLRTFLIVSGAVFVLGNVFLFVQLRKQKPGQLHQKGRAWPRILKVWAILIAAWLLILLLSRH